MSTPSGADMVKKQSPDEVQRIAQISWQIRQALRESLPAPPEQFFTVMVPGKVLNLNDYTGGYDAYGYPTMPLLPRDVQLAEAKLCDDMPALAGVQLGPTGKSVSRSYASALDKLTPSGATVGVLEPGNTNPSPDEQRYLDAMKWLLTKDPVTGKTHIQNYVEKQKAYNEAFEKKVKDFDAALEKARSDPANTTVELQRAAYDQFVAENARVYRAMVQAAFMDWVVVGKKEEVEYWFAVVDHDSILSRVEASKEAMRLSTVSTPDGSTDYQTVDLTPSNWAWLALQKGSGSVPKVRTVEWYTWEITRLSKLNLMLEVLRDNPPIFGTAPATDPPAGDDDTEGGALPAEVTATKTAIKDYIAARLAYDKLAKDDTTTADETKKTALKTAFDAVTMAQKALNDAFQTYDQDIVAGLTKHLDDVQDTTFTDLAKNAAASISANLQTIKDYVSARQKLLGDRAGDPASNVASELGIPPPEPDPAAAGVSRSRTTPDGRPLINPDDFWTSISVSGAESYDASQSSSSANSYSVGGGASWGLWSVGGSVNHSDATSRVASQMARSNISVSFDCLRVDIGRSWLRSELFYDSDITVTNDSFLSPGPQMLSWLMDPGSYQGPGTEMSQNARQVEIARYALFPLFPTAFLLAANVVMEIKGETSDIQSYFHTSTTSGSASVGWGPFSVSSSFSHTDTEASSSCEATSTGCRITTKGPQIIGWISEILPALPRINV